MNVNKTKISLMCMCLVSLILGASLVYMVYAQPTSTFWITGGSYPSLATYSVWREGNTYFAKDAYGLIPSWGENTDAVTVINSALNATETLGGGTVELSPQTFEIESPPIKVGHNTELRGNSRDATILHLANNALTMNHSPVVKSKYWYPADGDLGDDTWNITIRNFTIDGNKDGNLQGYDDSGGVNVGRAPNILIENLVVMNCRGWAGIYLGPRQANHYNTTSVIRNNIVYGTDSYDAHATYGNGIYVTATRNGSVLVENNICYNNFWAGILNEDLANYTIIRGNVCYGNLGAGISSANAGHVVITSNIVHHNFRGISGVATKDSIISNNIVEFNTYQGIYLTALSNNTVISGNIVRNNGLIGQGNFAAGIQVTDSNDCVITNNVAYDDLTAWRQWIGISETGTSDYTVIIGNNARDNGGHGIIVNGANTKVNLCWNGSTWIA